MRRFIMAAATVAAVVGVGPLEGRRAEAMALPGGLAAPGAAAEQVYVRCTRSWNGYRWVRRCVDYGPAYGPPGYGPPPPMMPPPPPPPPPMMPPPPRPGGYY